MQHTRDVCDGHTRKAVPGPAGGTSVPGAFEQSKRTAEGRDGEKHVGKILPALAERSQTEVTGVCHCSSRKVVVLWQSYKASPLSISAKWTSSIPTEGLDTGNIFYSDLDYSIELSPIFTICSTLHALIVTATTFADVFTPIIYKRSSRDKTSPCSMRQ